ncbi:MAG: endo-1,4-beta-xylanase [Melioribacteraceae bacterium]|nr:endo-1,4-beta-xylanase [Melioribacteraceae bacterium]
MFRSIVFVIVTFFAVNHLIAQTNLLTNPGFEDSLNVGWWLNAWGGGEGEVERVSGNLALTGDYSAKVTVITPQADNIAKVQLMSEPLINIPDGDLILKAKVRTESSFSKPFKLSLKCISESGEKKYYSSEEFTVSISPRTVEYTFNPESLYRDTILVRLMCGQQVASFIMDDISLVCDDGIPDPMEIPTGRRFKDIVADKYPDGNVYIGGSIGFNQIGTISEEILNREFSYITPNNDFKQSYIHPQPGEWRWEKSDTWVEKAAENNQVIRMHAPISPQCSKWAREDHRTAEELLQNLEEYMTEQCKRYNQYEHILWLDVVNETVNKTTGEWFGPREGTEKWENPWPIIGYDTTHSLRPPIYIKRAFELANEYAPNIKQIINQHGDMEDAAWDKIKALVLYLRENGLRVDGIGYQGHVDVGWEKMSNASGVNNITALENLIDWCHSNDLEFHVTENNVFLRNGNEGKFEEQAETFRAIVEAVLSKRESGVVSWNLWMLRDGFGQAGHQNPVLFYETGNAKPAYYAVQEVLEAGKLTDIDDEVNIALPSEMKLLQNYPNPFNPSTKISYEIPKNGFVNLTIYDALGRQMKTLVNKSQNSGRYSVEWDGKNYNNQNVTSGIYLAQLNVNGQSQSIKMMLMK